MSADLDGAAGPAGSAAAFALDALSADALRSSIPRRILVFHWISSDRVSSSPVRTAASSSSPDALADSATAPSEPEALVVFSFLFCCRNRSC